MQFSNLLLLPLHSPRSKAVGIAGDLVGGMSLAPDMYRFPYLNVHMCLCVSIYIYGYI